MEDSIIQKGFNAGYLLEKHLPQLSQALVKGFQDKENPYVQGFVAGSNAMAQERSQQKSKFLSKYDRPLDHTSSKEKTKGRGLDI